ncbi:MULTISPECIES: hydrogenase subunit MbhD domain-containing protein [unclassified Thioalkalivibrio]|uniref:hydrogenase subunit MbhD domain-containing protein n=1 Tax=unclassified Thioalkalivibrio TaxID=2621013 RepID=UPI00036058FF|nr:MULTISPECIES: hydrogenase subunit MbhD domain-containing protein [unclassified Thioalkalivibrio]
MSNLLLVIFDLVLLAGLLGVAWRCLASTDLFRAVVLFITFGLLLALAWVRLEAPDIALAEAAIGAGITGALLLVTLERLRSIAVERRRGRPDQPPDPAGADALLHALHDPPPPRRTFVPALSFALVVGGLMVTALWHQPDAVGLEPVVDEHMGVSGVDHPITAVLLNFRAYDTFLELAIVLIALLGAWSLGRYDRLPARPAPGPILPGTLRLLVPVAIVTGVYILWAGSHAPGGAFQAGAILGAAGILLVLARPRDLPMAPSTPLRLGLTAGVGLFLAIGIVGLFIGPGLLGYPPEWAYPLIIVIEIAATLSIALTLVALFIAGRPAGDDH